MFRFARRPSPALIVSCCALFVALGGTSYAVSIGSVGSREIRDGSIRGVDIANRTLRATKIAPDGLGGGAIKEQALDASKLDASAIGTVPHATSADTAGGVELRTIVTADGGRFHAHGVTDVNKIGTGEYIVTFDRDVRDCVGVATPIRYFDFYGPPSQAGTGEVAVQLPTGLPTPEQVRQVWVYTGTSDGRQFDHGFDLLVSC